MNIDNIHSFLLLAEHLNFAKAASEEHISQSTMSRKIDSMEKELGAKLFLRDSRNVTLTEAGKEFYFQAAKLLEQYNNTVELVQNAASGYQRELRVGIGFYEQFFLSRFLDKYFKSYPKIKFSLHQFPYQTLLEQFTRGNLDVIFTTDQFLSNVNSSKYEKHLICNHEWKVAMHKDLPLANCKHLAREMLNNQVLISMYNYSVDQIRMIYKNQNFSEPFRDIISVNSYEAKLTLVNANSGICFLPSFVLTKNYENVVLKDLVPAYCPRTFYAICTKGTYSDAIKELIQSCAYACRDLIQ